MADNEVRDYLLIVKRTRKLLYDKRLELKRLAEGLLEYETLTKEEMEKVVKGEPINKAKTMSNTVIKKSSKSSEIKIYSRPNANSVI